MMNNVVIKLFALVAAVYFVYAFGVFEICEFRAPSNSPIVSTPSIQYILNASAPAVEYLSTTTTEHLKNGSTVFTKHLSPLNSSITNNLCPNLQLQDFNFSRGILNSRIAIVLAVLTHKDYDDYMIAINTTECYAEHFGYQMHLINMTENPRIQQLCNHTDVFFKRHCALAIFMEDKKESIDYVLYIDADMGVINPCHTIQDYLDENKNVEITFYERYYDHEVAAGSYLVRNSAYSRKFIHFWADYFYRLPQSFHGTDNGAIHQVFMELNFDDPESKFQCYNLWNSSRGYDDLFAFQACTKHALNTVNTSLFVNETVKLIRKMTPGWVRDGWLTGTRWSAQDFMFHGWKLSKRGGEWQWPFTANFNMKKCQKSDTSFQNFKYLPQYVATDQEIKIILQQRVNSVEAAYLKILEKLNL